MLVASDAMPGCRPICLAAAGGPVPKNPPLSAVRLRKACEHRAQLLTRARAMGNGSRRWDHRRGALLCRRNPLSCVRNGQPASASDALAACGGFNEETRYR